MRGFDCRFDWICRLSDRGLAFREDLARDGQHLVSADGPGQENDLFIL